MATAEVPASKAAKNECKEEGCVNKRQAGSSRCEEHKKP